VSEKNASETSDATEQEYTRTGHIIVTVTSRKTGGRKATFEREVGRTLGEMAELYGEEVVHAMAVSEFVVRVQGACRTTLDIQEEVEGETLPKYTVEQGIAAALSYLPGKTRRRVDAGVTKEKAFQMFAKKLDAGEITLEQLMDEIRRRQEATQ